MPKKEEDNGLPYARDDEDFLTLVPETYDDADLVEWEPASTPISKPNEPGNLGKNRFYFSFQRFIHKILQIFLNKLIF